MPGFFVSEAVVLCCVLYQGACFPAAIEARSLSIR
jgi:hypothetical protein